MGLRVDLQARQIVVSVRALVEGGVDPMRGRGEMASLRAALGVELHQRRQADRAHEDGYTPELEVERAFSIDGWEATVRGRVDGVRVCDGTIEVEEIKSVQRTSQQLRAMDARDFADACLQAQLYALCLDPPGPVDVHLWLVSVLDGSTRQIPVPFEPEAVRARLDDRLRAAIAAAEGSAERVETLRRAAKTLSFPYTQPRPHQSDLVAAIDDALHSGRAAAVMAPTGSGKTACAMLPALGYALRSGARLFWATAKTTQQTLAASTLERLVDGAPIRGVTLRARSKMCPPGDLRCHPQVCPFLADYDERERAAGLVDQILNEDAVADPDRIYALGSEHRLCPYELALDVAGRADVIIGDYNYAFDSSAALRPFREETTRPNVVVVDEAHNLPDRARGYASPFLARAALRRARGVARADDVDDTLPRDADLLLSDLEVWIDGRLRAAAELEVTGVDGCVPHPLATDGWTRLASRSRRILLRHSLSRLRIAEFEPEDPLLAVLRTLVRVDEGLAAKLPGVVPYIGGPGATAGVGVGLMCVDASELLRPVHARALGTVAMSATLSPLDEHTRALGLDQLHPSRIMVPSPFPREHRLVAIVPTVSTTYRDRDEYAEAIAAAIETTVRARPGRYAAFFPSFAFLARIREHLQLPRDQCIVQIPGMNEMLRTTTLNAMRNVERERLLLAVSGGIFAEGVDLPGAALTGAIVVGPSLPAVCFERELIRQFHDDQGDAGFARAYLFAGMQRVVQAAGRVIRTMEDRGTIVLLGRRFADPNYASCLPEDWYRHSPSELITPDLGPTLEEFWAQTAAE